MEARSSGLVSTTRLWLKRGTAIENPIMIVGFPGLGRIGRIALKYLVRALRCDLVGIVTSPYFSAQAIITKDGSARLMRGEFYRKRIDPEHDLLLFTGDEHYHNIEGEYETSYKLLTFFKRKNGKMIITMGGHTTPSENPSRVLCFATTKDLLRKALAAGAIQAPSGTPIVGISGVLVALAKLRRVPAVCLLGETLGLQPDFRGANNVLAVLAEMLGLDVDLSPLETGAESLAKLMENLQRQYDVLVQTSPIQEVLEEAEGPGPGPDYVS